MACAGLVASFCSRSSSTDAAEATQFQNGAEAVDVIPVYANTEFVFIPDGYHVMLIGLKQDLHVGDEIKVVLHFRDHEDITLTVPVGEASGHEHDHNGYRRRNRNSAHC